jgi:hypothetical protein
MNTMKKIISVFCFLLACFSANAQKNLSINNVFENYGKQNGSTLVELAKDVLKDHTKINNYKSMIVPFSAQIADACSKAIANDIENGSLMQESIKDGKTEAACYCLARKNDSSDYEYILFTCKNKKITLIYVKGNFEPNQLEQELNKLKKLFIKANNKQIKL